MKSSMSGPVSVFAATVKFKQNGKGPYIFVYIYGCIQVFIYSVSAITTI